MQWPMMKIFVEENSFRGGDILKFYRLFAISPSLSESHRSKNLNQAKIF